jgi:hypothetical protein
MPLAEITQLLEEPWLQRSHKLEDIVDVGRNSSQFLMHGRGFGTTVTRDGTGDFILLSREMFEAIGAFIEVGYDQHIDNMLMMKMARLITGFVRC